MKNVEKSKLLREIRKNLGWTQQQMADELELQRTYISELETNAVPVSDWILKKVEILSKRPPSSENRHLEEGISTPSEEACFAHLRDFLRTCEGDTSKIGWTLVELRERFPLDKWETIRERLNYRISSTAPSGDVEKERALTAAPLALRHARKSGRPQNTDATTGDKSHPGGESDDS